MLTEDKDYWKFDNTYAQLSDKLFARQAPIPVSAPETVIFNKELSHELGLGFLEGNQEDIARLFSGNSIPKGAAPIAQAYAGHQFGHFTMLGDGRAILLGELMDTLDQRFDLQLKGSGRTPFSRGGDGRATLSSMLREYLMSEAMHYLGIGTTRSLAVVKTGEKVIRPEVQDGAVLTRIASSHIRVGTFEYVRKFGGKDHLKTFTEYVINRHYPELLGAENPPLELIRVVMHRQIDLIVDWMRVGFIHGVMNTDNMSISGETIDYGPCAFMNSYHPMTVFSSIDTQGRYAFQNQPYIANWNLMVFATALLPLIDDDQKKAVEKGQAVLDGMKDIYMQRYDQMMVSKLGLSEPNDDNKKMVQELLDWMQENKADYNDTFRKLSTAVFDFSGVYASSEFKQWFNRWSEVFDKQGNKNDFLSVMKKVNPVFIPRNHLVEEVLARATEGDMKPFTSLLERLQNPYDESDKDEVQQAVPQGFDERYQTFCGT